MKRHDDITPPRLPRDGERYAENFAVLVRPRERDDDEMMLSDAAAKKKRAVARYERQPPASR